MRHMPDAGSATVELAILLPLGVILLLSVLQAGLWWHTQSVCQHAAWLGVTAARTTTGTTASADHVARAFLARSGTAAGNPEVHVEATTADVTVRVAATAPRVLPIPGLDFRAEHLARASREHFTTPGAAP